MISIGRFLNIYSVAGLGVFLVASCRLVSSSSPWLYLGLHVGLVGFILGCSMVLFHGQIKPPIYYRLPAPPTFQQARVTKIIAKASARPPKGQLDHGAISFIAPWLESTDGQFQSTKQPDYKDYRAEATLHFKQRDECFKKAAKAYQSGQKDLASYYSNQGHLHSTRLKEANRRAAELILVQRKHVTGENKLDLHNLHVEEALQALQKVLLEREQQLRRGTPSPGQQRYLEVVTGRGRHSKMGVAKLKPAVAKFLEQRGYRFTVLNAGSLKVYFSPEQCHDPWLPDHYTKCAMFKSRKSQDLLGYYNGVTI